MKRPSDSLARIIWRTPLLRSILIVVVLASVILPGYDLLAVYPSFERLLAASIEKEASRTTRYLLHVLGGNEQGLDAFSREKIDQAAWERLNHATEDFGLWKTRIFSPGGEIIFSTISEEIGQLNKNDYFFDVVAKGRPFTKIERKQGKSMEGEVLPVDVVETYVPVLREGRFLGAIEVYYDITEEKGLLQSLLFRSGLIFVGLIVAIVMAIILLLIRTAMGSREFTQIQKDLHTQEMMFRDVIDSAHDGIMVTDATQRIQIVNPAFSELTGYSEQDVLDQTPSILKSGRQDASFYDQMWRSIHEHKCWRGEIWNKHKDGGIYPELLSISTIDDETDGVTHYVGMFTDISQQKASEQRYLQMAHHDPLTQLPNRLLFLDRLEQAIRESVRSGEHVVLLFLDLDEFKQVNDNAGHDAGDALLQEVARRLSDSVRRNDTVARIGGDEFTLVLRNINSRDVIEHIANKLIWAIKEPITVEDASFHIGASVGIACYPGDAGDAETLIAMADEAMYEAKQLGKNNFVLRCDSLS